MKTNATTMFVLLALAPYAAPRTAAADLAGVGAAEERITPPLGTPMAGCYVELGLAIKRASPFAHTIVVELANGSIGCVPTRHARPQGNYEVVSARCGPGSGEMRCEAASALLREAYAAAVRADAK